jgi:RNA polymerase sigma factor (sigma-70 family)
MAGHDTSLGVGPQEFPQTTWGLVSKIRKGQDERQVALETLCTRYWRPIYCYVRRAWRKSNEDAKDVTQAFFLWLMDGEVLSKYATERSSFRFYLKGVLRNYMRNSEQALKRLKRGGDVKHLPLANELRDLADTIPDPSAESPEEAFDRAWVDELIERATERTQETLLEAGRELRCAVFRAYELAPPGAQPTYSGVAEQLGIKVSDVRNHLFAVRERLRTEIRNELRETVSSTEQLESEWHRLFCD